MLSSMTGYGRQIVERDSYRIVVEMRSVNNRFLDISLKMPRSLLHLEDKIRRIIKNYFSRGKFEIYISITGQGNITKKLHVDWELLGQYIEQIEEIKKRHQVKGEVAVDDLLKLEEIFNVDEEEKQDEALKDLLFQAVENSCEELQEMRQTEGTYLKNDLLLRLNKMEELTESLQAMRSKVVQSYRERIRNRINEHLAQYAQIEDGRIIQEVAVLAEKGDITEELTRLSSHISQMRKVIDKAGSVGRKLDFICQEMHREANTIGSKSTAAEINEIDVLLKTEIEKIKEQVQNIE
ncbi:YicC family protein [Oceanobacillus luteolus]|uniref:YicC/YloC family endoribonuclease n=1 Tax=Oceanobacillus luteolus TaxID=1274358 RepID=A0ABW4HPU5_9BACI|nr:YicC/YloC family endoribonuclease [Oceanobacillus luteolus]MCM3739104.1 YicC family protein [Oceanobacillus luteolus]